MTSNPPDCTTRAEGPDEGNPADRRPEQAIDGRNDFDRLYGENQTDIIGFARRLRQAGSITDGETMDAVNDAATSFLSHTRRVKSDTHFLNLFRKFIHNAVRFRRRFDKAEKRGGDRARDRWSEIASGVSSDQTGPVTRAGLEDRRSRIRDALHHLDPDERKLIYLRIWENRSWADIARTLDCPSEDAARIRYSRALKRLQDLVPELD
jgi:RNA polymerase sigma factor (sigma-70 family)